MEIKIDDFINLTVENLDSEHLCCIIRSKKPHQGIEAKKSGFPSDLMKVMSLES